MTQLTRQLVLLYIAIICFVIAFLVAIGAIDGNFGAWIAGGLAFSAGSRVP